MRSLRAGADPLMARFPAVRARAGFYESFYLRACDPGGRRGVWIRYTVHKRPGVPPRASLWFVLWDPAEGPPYAVKETHPPPALGAGGGDVIRIGEARLGQRSASGSAQAQGRSASWQLEVAPRAAPLLHLPRGWMYGAPLPRTKTLSPAPSARFSGRIEA